MNDGGKSLRDDLGVRSSSCCGPLFGVLDDVHELSCHTVGLLLGTTNKRSVAWPVQIRSSLHQQQLMRAMKRVILGLGAAPSAPRQLECRQVSIYAPACP